HRIIDEGVRADDCQAVANMPAADTRTVVPHLSRPSATLLTHLAYPMNTVVDRKVVQAHDGSLAHADCGAGPLRLVRWRHGTKQVLKRFKEYYLPTRPFVDQLILRPIPDDTARTTALRTGEVDMISKISPKDLLILKNAPHVVISS